MPYTKVAGSCLHTAAPLPSPARLGYRQERRSRSSLRVQALSEDSAHRHTTLQRALGLGLGLALSLGVTAAPANADTIQDIQKAASGTTLGQTVQSLTGGNPVEGLKRQTQSAVDSASKAAPSGGPSQPSLDLPGGPSVGNSLKDAFTKSPPLLGDKGYGSSSRNQPLEITRGKFSLAAGLFGGAILLLSSSLLAQNKGAPKAAAKKAKSSASKVSGLGSQPVQKAKGLLGNVRSGGTQPFSKGAKSATKKAQGGTGRAGGKASSAAKQAQQKVAGAGGSIPAAGIAAAGLVAAGVLFTVIAKPGAVNAPVIDDSSPQETLGSAGAGAQGAAEAAKQKGSQAAAKATDVTSRVPPQSPQGDTFELSLSDGTPGPNKEPLDLRPSVDKVDAPKAGGIPIFGPKGQREAGAATATPEEEGSGQQSIVKPKGYKSKPQAGQDLSAKLDFDGSVQEVDAKLGGVSVPNPFESKGNPQQEQTTDQRLEPQGPAAQAQRSADQAAMSTSDENRIDRDT